MPADTIVAVAIEIHQHEIEWEAEPFEQMIA
jgi:hypothetical protein